VNLDQLPGDVIRCAPFATRSGRAAGGDYDVAVLGEGGLSGGQTVALTIVGAAVGSLLAVALQSWVSRRGSHAHFRALMAAVEAEVVEIKTQAAERASRPPNDLRFDPSYSTFAWSALSMSMEVRRLGRHYSGLAAFYSEVSAANHRLALVASLAQTSAISPYDEVRLEYRNLAQKFSAESQGAVASSAERALEACADLLKK
jgi:hypothetical protein